MSFVPEVPGFTPMSYGQGYGDWHQYGGFNSKNSFGSMPNQPISSKNPVAPTAAIPVIDAIPTMPNAQAGQYGTQPQESFGSTPSGQYGSIDEAVKADQHNY